MDRETGGEGWELYRRRSWQRRRSHDEGSPRLSGSAPPCDGLPWPLPPWLKSTPHVAFRKPLDGACGRWPGVLGGRPRLVPCLGFISVGDERIPRVARVGEGEGKTMRARERRAGSTARTGERGRGRARGIARGRGSLGSGRGGRWTSGAVRREAGAARGVRRFVAGERTEGGGAPRIPGVPGL